ncbi:MAG: hypothetical protein IJU11_06720 [Prevotella sp.]|nr:hypothetical protein [Prevotella sp.]
MRNKSEQTWVKKCQDIMDYMVRHKRRPSKHRMEDHRMLNWIKYNRKRMAAGKLTGSQASLFHQLTAMADEYRKLNQYAYSGGNSTRQEPDLFDNCPQ